MRINEPAEACYIVCLSCPGGGEGMLELSLEEGEQYNADPDGYAANYFGLSTAEYVEWINTCGTPLCGARTKSGKLCRTPTGRMQQDAAAWMANHRAFFCRRHQGP
jgi:hypothetical protein